MNKIILPFGMLLFGMNCVVAQSETKISVDSTQNRFTLGEVTIYGNKNSPIFNAVRSDQFQSFAKNDVAKALNLLPGISQSQIGPRNETMLYIRGFDLRSVPVLIDGIPVYVPYDGYVDLGRFLTFDLAEVQIAKGYTSVNYGPNAMGGAINLITRKPVKPFEVNGATGWQSGGYRSNFNIGSNLGKFYVQTGISKYKRNYIPISKDFVPVTNEDGGHRDNSYTDDEKISLKVAYKPSDKSEYALSYAYQHGSKGSPVYAGQDSRNSLFSKPRYWQWPKWDKQSLYFLSNTSIDTTQYIRSRFYYDQFINKLNSYDDATYTTISKPYAFTSLYNDFTIGGIVEYGKNFGRIDRLQASVQYKQDVHRENNVGEPRRTMSDGTFSVGVENQLDLTRQLMFLTGLSFNSRSSIKAQDYNSSSKEITDYPSNQNNAVNIQGALQYSVNTENLISLSVARKTRFATTKDRYSYRLGTAVPNPDLASEYAINYDLSYKGKFLNNRLSFIASVFRSDIHNTILLVPNVTQNASNEVWLSQLQNVGRTQNMGVELGADFHVVSGLLLGANYTYIKRKNLTDPSVYLTDVPKDKLFGYARYSWHDKISIQANGEYNSGRYSTVYGIATSPFAVFGSSATAHVWKWFSIEAGVNNLFDRNYALVEGYPEAGRNFFANLIYRL